MLDKLASTISHKTLAKLIDLGAAPPEEPVSCPARSIEHSLQVVVYICKYEPWVADRERLDAFLARVAREAEENVVAKRVSSTQVSERAIVLNRLTPLMRDIYHLLRADRPTKLSVLAAKLGKKPGGSFRTLCSMLCILGLAKNVKGEGYVLLPGDNL